MANTRQIVLWALEQKCLLRDSEDSMILPSTAMKRVRSAKAYSRGLRDRRDGFGVFGDILVTSYTFGARPEGQKGESSPAYPASGLVIADEFKQFGGPEALFGMCHACPANVRPHEIAECAGSIFQGPHSPETETQLRSIISRLGLENDMERLFPATTPLWYGLWAVSPVPAASLPMLKTLLSEMLAEDKRDGDLDSDVGARQSREFSTLIAAIELAEKRRLPLRVELLPLGHTDFGIYTIFPHCPFCKAAARVKPWQRKYPTELHTCEVCGTRFSPAETASARRMDREVSDLRDLLGPERFQRFAKDYLIARGETPEAAEGIVEASEAKEIKRQEKWQQNQELARRRQQFLEDHIFIGLPCLRPPKSELIDDTEEKESPSGSTGWFDAENLAEVLQRCERLGINVSFLQHNSSNGQTDRFESKKLKAPLEILSQWQAEGCNEKFYVACRVPDSLVSGSNDSKL